MISDMPCDHDEKVRKLYAYCLSADVFCGDVIIQQSQRKKLHIICQKYLFSDVDIRPSTLIS